MRRAAGRMSSSLILAAPLGVVLVVLASTTGEAPPAGAPPGPVVATTGSATDTLPPRPDTLRLEGEFGLAVHLDADSLHVRWITGRDARPGFLRARADEAVIHDTTTPPDSFHLAGFLRPETSEVLLEYGLAEDAERRHRTRIHLDLDDRSLPPASVSGVDTLFAVADIHGEYDNMIRVFRNAGLIDEEGRWAGGTSHLAVLGDMLGRGMDAIPVLWFLYRLEREAEEAGGRIHVVLGNHEFMVMLGDLRYVQGKELWMARGHGMGYDRLFDPRYSVLGRWLTSKPAAVRVDDVLMAHGGVSRDYLDYTVESLQDSLAVYVEEDLFYHYADTTVPIVMDSAAFERRNDFFWGERSVIWYRGYATSDTLDAELGEVLDHFGSALHVVGHTPVRTIREAYEGDLILVNTFPFADQVLRLVRTDEGYERLRIPQEGAGLPLDTGLADAVALPDG